MDEARISKLTVCRRFHRPSGLALVVGMAVLEDVDFLASFTAKNRKHLTASYKLVTSALDEKGIPYVKGGYVTLIQSNPFNSQYLLCLGVEASLFTSTCLVFCHPERMNTSPR